MIFLIFVFLILTFNGFVVSHLLFRTNNKLLMLGSSMIVGQLAFLLILSILSYFLKGPFGIQVIFWSFFLAALVIFFRYLKNHSTWKDLFGFKLTLSNIFIALLLVLYIVLLFIYASGFNVGADADIYWGIATSFTRGNYPTVLPWQPKYLTVYHEGTFIVEGAIRALVPVGIATIHNFFTAFILSAILFLVIGIMRERTRSIFCLLPAVFGIFLFGGPVILIGGFQNIIANLNNLSQFPGHESFRGGNGSGASDLVGLMYVNFYTFGLASFLIFIYVFYIQTKKAFNFLNYFILVILSILSSSIDETFFAVEVVLLAALLIWQVRKEKLGKVLLNAFYLSLVFFIFFSLIQNPIRDSFLTPSPEAPRFKLSLESDNSLVRKYMFGKNKHILWNGKDTGVTVTDNVKETLGNMGQKKISVNGTDWYILDLTLLSAALLFVGILIRSNLSLFLTVSGVLSLLFALFIVNTYWPPNNLRFVSQASQLAMFALGILMVDLISGKQNQLKILLFALILVSMTPQILVTHAKFLKLTFSGRYEYFSQNLIDRHLAEIENLVPSSARIIFLDDYPTDAPSTYLNSSAVNRHGLFVPFSPPEPKVIAVEKGMEWYDAVYSLSPYAFKILSIDYVYIQGTAQKRLSADRIRQIGNLLYFQKIRNWDGAVLYRVNQPFKDIVDDELSIKKIVSIIDTGKKVYLDKFYLNELRHIFLLNLSKRNHLIGPPHAHGGDFFMYIETDIPFEDACKTPPCDPKALKALEGIEYALMKPENDPNIILQGKYQKVVSIKHVDLWRNIQKQ